MDVVNLLDGAPFDPAPILAGPWRWLRISTLEPGRAERLDPGDVEYAVYVIEGEGEAQLADRSVPIQAGSALTLLKGAEATLTAAKGTLRVFLVAVDT